MKRSLLVIAVVAMVALSFYLGRATAPVFARNSRYEIKLVSGWPAKIDKRDGTVEFLQPKK